jgi:hypothetical protein
MFFKPNEDESHKISDESNIQLTRLSENRELSKILNFLFYQKFQMKKITLQFRIIIVS